MIRFVVQKCTGLDKIMTALFWKQKLTMWEEFPDEMKRLHRCVGMDTQGGTRRSKMATGDLSWTWERAAATDRVQEPPTGSRVHRPGPAATDRVQQPAACALIKGIAAVLLKKMANGLSFLVASKRHTALMKHTGYCYLY